MGILVFLGLSLVIIVHELGHFAMSKIFKVHIEEFGLGFPPKIWSKKIGETLYSINWIIWGGFLKISGMRKETERMDIPPDKNFVNQAFYKKALIIVGGVLMNFFLGWMLISLVMNIGIPQSIFVSDIKINSPAYMSGFQKGDLILNFENSEEFNSYLNQNKGTEIIFNIKRDGVKKEITTKLPEERLESGELLGIYYGETGVEKSGFWKSIFKGFETACGLVFFYLKGYISLLSGIFTDSSVFQNLISPIGLFSMGAAASKVGIVYFLQLLAHLSINLIIFNFLPFPMLDGGWFLLSIIEKIKGSPINHKIEAVINGFGFIVLFSLFLAITIKDLINLF
ncbi:site-2 protease family protein [Patescibacteria group bacterium]|nr:site-2 protease family protein [Patescibacteria group bacterium]